MIQLNPTLIGHVPMSAKPFTKGHALLLQLAAQETQHSCAYISLKPRENITSRMCEQIWALVEPHMSEAQSICVCEVSPVGSVYEQLGQINEDLTDTVSRHVIYGDPHDLLKNFPDKSLRKYLGRLWTDGRVSRRPVERHLTDNVSGTVMRDAIRRGDKVMFVAGLPSYLDGNAVWNIVTSR